MIRFLHAGKFVSIRCFFCRFLAGFSRLFCSVAFLSGMFVSWGAGFAAAREVVDFNDGWQFVKSDVDVNGGGHSGLRWADVSLPHTWNANDAQSGGDCYTGTGCYRKTFFVDEAKKDRRFFLRFEGVGQVAEVFVNGISVGGHKGAYSAFCLDITPALKFGADNEVFVKADNAVPGKACRRSAVLCRVILQFIP